MRYLKKHSQQALSNCNNLFNKKSGNVIDKDISEVYKENIHLLKDFATLILAYPNSKCCNNCIYINFCSFCLLRTLSKAKELKEKLCSLS